MDFDICYPIKLNETEVSTHSNVLRTAKVLSVGLTYPYRFVFSAETQVRSRRAIENGPDSCAFAFGNAPELSEIPMDLIECMFRWYAVTACDFVRVATWISKFDNNTRKEYEAKVLGAVLAFRDKIGAHTAGVTQNNRDNDAERMFSTFCQIGWSGDRFKAGMLTLSVKRGSNSSDSKALQPWSLTEFHRDLCERYPLIAKLT